MWAVWSFPPILLRARRNVMKMSLFRHSTMQSLSSVLFIITSYYSSSTVLQQLRLRNEMSWLICVLSPNQENAGSWELLLEVLFLQICHDILEPVSLLYVFIMCVGGVGGDVCGGQTTTVGVRSLPPSCASWVVNSGCQAWWKDPIPTKPRHRPLGICTLNTCNNSDIRSIGNQEKWLIAEDQGETSIQGFSSVPPLWVHFPTSLILVSLPLTCDWVRFSDPVGSSCNGSD